MSKYSEEEKGKLKEGLLNEFEKLSDTASQSAIIRRFMANIKEEEKKIADGIPAGDKAKKKELFGRVLGNFLGQSDENISEGFIEVNKIFGFEGEYGKPLMSFKEYFNNSILNTQKNEQQQEQKKGPNQELQNNNQNNNDSNKQSKENLDERDLEHSFDKNLEQQRKRSKSFDVKGNLLNLLYEDLDFKLIQARERWGTIYKKTNLNNEVSKQEKDEAVAVSGNSNINVIENNVDKKSNSASVEDDLYSKIMNINLNRAAIIDKELLEQGKDFDGTKKYHSLSPEEINYSKNKLNYVLRNSVSGITSFDELDKNTEGKEKLTSLKDFDTSKHDKSYIKLSEAIPFQSTDYKQASNSNTKSSEIKVDGKSIGSLDKTKIEIDIGGGNKVEVWQARLNLDDDKSKGHDVAAKLYLYDERGNQSDLSIIIGKDKNGIPVISAQLDIEAGKGDDLVKIKRDKQTYIMPITYNDYEKYHEAMLNKTQFKEMEKNLSKNLEANKGQQPKEKDGILSAADIKKVIGNNLIEEKTNNNGGVTPKYAHQHKKNQQNHK